MRNGLHVLTDVNHAESLLIEELSVTLLANALQVVCVLKDTKEVKTRNVFHLLNVPNQPQLVSFVSISVFLNDFTGLIFYLIEFSQNS